MLKRRMSRLALRALSSSPLPVPGPLSLVRALRPGTSLTVTSLIPTPCPCPWTAVTVRGVGWLATGFSQGKAGRKLAGPSSTATAGVTVRPTLGRTSQAKQGQAYCTEGDAPHESIPFSRFPVPDRLTLPKDMQERMDEVEEKSGFLPNVFKALAYRPDEFRAFFSYYDALMEKKSDSLTKAEKELIVVVTSADNDCLYCVVAHSALHRIYSRNKFVADQLATHWQSATLTDRERAIAKFSLDICNCRHTTDEDLQALSEYGLSKDDVWDIGAIAAFFALSNRMANLTAMRPNEQFYLMGRVKKDKKQ